MNGDRISFSWLLQFPFGCITDELYFDFEDSFLVSYSAIVSKAHFQIMRL